MEKRGGKQRSRGELQSSRLKRGRRILQQRSWIFPPLRNLAEGSVCRAFSPSRNSTSTQKICSIHRKPGGTEEQTQGGCASTHWKLVCFWHVPLWDSCRGGWGRSSTNCCSSSEILQIKEQRKQRTEDEVILTGQQHTQRQSTSHGWT